MITAEKQFESRVIDRNIGYFRFYEGATQEDYQNAFEDYMKIVSDPKVTKLVVVNDKKGKWDQAIENIWIETGKMAERFGIKKWGVVTPDSAIREMTLKRVVKSGYTKNPNYDFFLSRNEFEVLDWIKKD